MTRIRPLRPAWLLVAAATGTAAYSIPMGSDLFARSSECISNFFPCATSGLPDNFCCPNNTVCDVLAGNTTVLCCPTGADCSRIQPITCDLTQENAALHPDATIKTTALNGVLSQCGSGTCCPFGYSCNSNLQCQRDSNQNAAPITTSPTTATSTSSKSKSKTTTTKTTTISFTSSTASTTSTSTTSTSTTSTSATSTSISSTSTSSTSTSTTSTSRTSASSTSISTTSTSATSTSSTSTTSTTSTSRTSTTLAIITTSRASTTTTATSTTSTTSTSATQESAVATESTEPVKTVQTASVVGGVVGGLAGVVLAGAAAWYIWGRRMRRKDERGMSPSSFRKNRSTMSSGNATFGNVLNNPISSPMQQGDAPAFRTDFIRKPSSRDGDSSVGLVAPYGGAGASVSASAAPYPRDSVSPLSNSGGTGMPQVPDLAWMRDSVYMPASGNMDSSQPWQPGVGEINISADPTIVSYDGYSDRNSFDLPSPGSRPRYLDRLTTFSMVMNDYNDAAQDPATQVPPRR